MSKFVLPLVRYDTFTSIVMRIKPNQFISASSIRDQFNLSYGRWVRFEFLWIKVRVRFCYKIPSSTNPTLSDHHVFNYKMAPL